MIFCVSKIGHELRWYMLLCYPSFWKTGKMIWSKAPVASWITDYWSWLTQAAMIWISIACLQLQYIFMHTYMYYVFLVGGLEYFFIFPYIGNTHPNWLIYFRRVETTNQKTYIYIEISYMYVFTICIYIHNIYM
jgi:hypothetical protein